METGPTSPTEIDGQLLKQQHQFESANNFLEICDRLNTGYESGLYWEDVQRALRIAAGLETWP